MLTAKNAKYTKNRFKISRISRASKKNMLWAEIIVYAAGIYLAIGFLFALYFVIFGVTQLDESAKGTSFGFRFLIFFGAVAFWVLLAWRLFKGEKRPMEQNAHRQKSLEAK